MENLLQAEHPVIFHHNGFGDRLLGLPTLRAVASLFAGRLRLFCAQGDNDIFYAGLPLSQVYETPIRRGNPEWTFDARAVAEALGECDLFVCLNPWHSKDVDELIGYFPSAETVGFFRNFKHARPFNHSKHAADAAFDVLRWFDSSLRIEDFAQPAQLPRASVEAARRLRREVPPPFRVMVVHTETLATKMWPVEKFISLLDRFVTRHPDFIVFVVDTMDYGLGGGRYGSNIFPCTQLPLATAFALVGEADFFLGIDSCMLHAADFFRVPGVGLFGLTSCHEFGFRFGPHRHVSANGPIAAIDEETVLAALESLIADTPQPSIKIATTDVCTPARSSWGGKRGSEAETVSAAAAPPFE